MTVAALFHQVCALACSDTRDLSIDGTRAFPRAFVRAGVLHARRPGIAMTVEPQGAGLQVRTWVFSDVADVGLLDLVAETQITSARPTAEEHVDWLLHSREPDQVFEVGMLLVRQVRIARQSAKFPTLITRLPGLRLLEAGGVAPYWAEGDWQGYRVTFRARFGTARLSIFDHSDSNEALWEAAKKCDDPFSMSVISDDEFVQYFLELAPLLSVAPFAYRFDDLAPRARHTDIHDRPIQNVPFVGWGHSSAEARANVVEHFYRMYPGEDPESNISPLPLHEDMRFFPTVMPAFTVLDAL